MGVLYQEFDARPTPRYASILVIGPNPDTAENLNGLLSSPDDHRIHIPYMMLNLSEDFPIGSIVRVQVQAGSPRTNQGMIENFFFTKKTTNVEQHRIPGPFTLYHRGSGLAKANGYVWVTSDGVAGYADLVIPHVSYSFRGDFKWSDIPLQSGKVDVYGIEDLVSALTGPPVEGTINEEDVTANPWNNPINVSDEISVEGKKGISFLMIIDQGDATGNFEFEIRLLSRDSSILVHEPFYDTDFESQLLRYHYVPAISGGVLIEMPTEGRIPKVQLRAACPGATTAKILAGGKYYLGG